VQQYPLLLLLLLLPPLPLVKMLPQLLPVHLLLFRLLPSSLQQLPACSTGASHDQKRDSCCRLAAAAAAAVQLRHRLLKRLQHLPLLPCSCC
jgi:hypothetical protein